MKTPMSRNSSFQILPSSSLGPSSSSQGKPETSRNMERLKSINWNPRNNSTIPHTSDQSLIPKAQTTDFQPPTLNTQDSHARLSALNTQNSSLMHSSSIIGISELVHLSVTQINKYTRSKKLSIILNSCKMCWSVPQTQGDRPNSSEYTQLSLIKNKLYLIGGQYIKDFTDVKTFDPQTNHWSNFKTTQYPNGLIGFISIPYKNNLFIYGGYSLTSNSQRKYTKSVYKLSVKDRKWNKLKTYGLIPHARKYHAGCKIGRFFLVYGGELKNSATSADLLNFDIKTHFWEVLSIPKGPGAKSSASLSAVFLSPGTSPTKFHTLASMLSSSVLKNSGIYLFGGKDSASRCSSDLYCISANSEKLCWSKIDARGCIPPARHSHAAASINHRIFVFGGRGCSLDSTSIDVALGDLHVFNVFTLMWQEFEVKGISPCPRWGHSVAAVGSKIMVFGGLTHRQVMSAEIYCLETDTDVVSKLYPEDEKKIDRREDSCEEY